MATRPGSQPQPHPQNHRREAAVDLEFPVTFLRGGKLNEEEKSPILPLWSQEAEQQASRPPAMVIRNKTAQRDFSKLWQEQPKAKCSHIYFRALQPVVAIIVNV